MRKVYLLIAIVVVLVGGVLATQLKDKEDSSSMPSISSNEASTSEVRKEFEGYKGEDYDRMFLANMMAHHQGAVDMANLATANAKHQELKDMAQKIISDQNIEIAKMKQWQSQWGYPASSGEEMVDHSAMGMSEDMARMTEELKGLSGDEFDKKFISLMIEHHESAIDMAAPGLNNAAHQEVRDLSIAIVNAQTGEVKQMQQWQKDWAYTN